MAVLSYHLRVQKEIERRLFLEILSFIDRHWPIPDAVYIGMGSVYFEDFKAMHDRFGVKQMICLEREEWLQKRQSFNLPLSPSCIELCPKSANDFISNFGFEKSQQFIIWLDFDEFQHVTNHLNTFVNLLSHLREGDVAKITLDATYSKIEQKIGKDIPKDRRSSSIRDIIQEKLGDYFPHHCSHAKIDSWIKNREYGRILTEAIIIASERGTVPGLQLSPLASFIYSDSGKADMLTFTGIVSETESDIIKKLDMKNFPFIYNKNFENRCPYRIAPLPIMTPREKMLVDQCLPLMPEAKHTNKAHKDLLDKGVQFDKDEKQSLKLLKKYAELYRFHPDYRKISP